jgi:hypothetical protein
LLDAANDKIVNLTEESDALKLEKQTLINDLTAMTSERDMAQVAQRQVTTYEDGLKTIFAGETIVKDDGVTTKVIPTIFEPSQTILNIAT